jgi:hypothetical protein
MARPRINVRNKDENHQKWGKLVKTWSTGRDYVRHVITDDAPFPKDDQWTKEFPEPKTFAELVAQCRAVGVELYFDDGASNPDVQGTETDITLKVVRFDSNTMVLRLPPADKIKESEERLVKPGEIYKVPMFYDRIYGAQDGPGETTASKVDKAKLHAERVGEYTINTCG